MNFGTRTRVGDLSLHEKLGISKYPSIADPLPIRLQPRTDLRDEDRLLTSAR